MKKQRLIMRTVILLLLGAAVVYTLYANFTKDDNPEIEVGKKAPDFVLTDLNGEKYRLSDFEGKGVLLNFWATWCPPCEREMPYLEQQYQKYNDEGIQVLTVNVGEPTVTIKEFIDRLNLTFPVVNDKNQEVLTAYGVDPLPITFLIDKDGIIKKIHKGEIINEAVIADMTKEIKP